MSVPLDIQPILALITVFYVTTHAKLAKLMELPVPVVLPTPLELLTIAHFPVPAMLASMTTVQLYA